MYTRASPDTDSNAKTHYPEPLRRKTTGTTHAELLVKDTDLHATDRIIFIYARQNEEPPSRGSSKLALHSFQSQSSWLRFDGRTVNGVNKCINPFCSTRFGKKGLFCDQRLERLTRI